MSNNPLISIIIPYFCGADHLKESVSSALAQTHESIEIIIVDDLGPDLRAEEALRTFSDSRIRIINHEKNLGAAAARNTAGKAALGQFILPLDADDLLDPRYIELTLPYFSDAKIGGVYTAVKTFGDEETIYSPEWTVSGIISGKAGALICLLYRKALFDQLDGYDTRWRVGEDSDFFLRAVSKGWAFHRLDTVLYHYRKHAQSTTSNHSSQTQMEMSQNLIRFHGELCRKHIEEIVEYKDNRYWELIAEYKHLHTEFHKLLALYTNLQDGISQSSKQPVSLLGRIKDKICRSI